MDDNLSRAARRALPAEPRPKDVVVRIDTREQIPWTLSPLATESATLDVGDYDLAVCPGQVVIERKGFGDFLSCCGGERARWERQLLRLRGVLSQLVIVECTWQDIERGQWSSRLSRKAVVGSVIGWMTSGTPFVFGGRPDQCDAIAARFFYVEYRRRWRELRQMVGAVE
ncbi:MAG: hypothetical protein KDA99_25525 [Planctomycetales bacterium]|nr:hypothetical protein [Planctomycetales bacterium]